MNTNNTIKNIVVICIDTFRKDFLKVYNSQNPVLKNLTIESKLTDFIQKHGNVFTYDKYFPVSYPTVQYRRDMFEGRPYWKYGFFEPIPEDSVTLASILTQKKIATQCITDIPHYMSFNLSQGFNGYHWIPGHSSRSEKSRNFEGIFCYPHNVPLKHDTKMYRYEAAPAKVKYRNLHFRSKPFFKEVFETSEKWLSGYKKNERNPFFLWMDLWEPHEPWNYLKNDNGLELVDPAYVDSDFFSPDQQAEIRNSYADLHKSVSDESATFIEFIQQQGYLKDTLLFIISDHGFSLGEHGKFGKLPSRDTLNRNLPDKNLWGLFEEEIGIPFIAFMPEAIDASKIKLNGVITPFELRNTILSILLKDNNYLNIFNDQFSGLETSLVITAGNAANDFNKKKHTVDYLKFGFTVIEDFGKKRTIFFGNQADYMYVYNMENDPYQLNSEVVPKYTQKEVDDILSKY